MDCWSYDGRIVIKDSKGKISTVTSENALKTCFYNNAQIVYLLLSLLLNFKFTRAFKLVIFMMDINFCIIIFIIDITEHPSIIEIKQHSEGNNFRFHHTTREDVLKILKTLSPRKQLDVTNFQLNY